MDGNGRPIWHLLGEVGSGECRGMYTIFRGPIFSCSLWDVRTAGGYHDEAALSQQTVQVFAVELYGVFWKDEMRNVSGPTLAIFWFEQ
jgi:hypothetical protein